MVGVIVVNYNSKDEVVRLVDSLQNQSFSDFTLLIVDNDSPDSSGKKLKEELKNCDVLINKINLGFAAGVNFGISHLKTSPKPPKYYWILNPDMTVGEQSLVALVNRIKEREAVIGSKVIFPSTSDGQTRIWAAGGFVDFYNQNTVMRGNGEVDQGQFDESSQCDYVPGCSLFVSGRVLDEVGPFPEEYFLYFEETDWCQKAMKKGFPIIFEPQSVVTHFFREEKLSEPLVTYYYNRNKRLFFFKHCGFLSKVKLIFKTLFQDLPRARKSLTESPDERYRLLFKSHVDSCIDFIFMRFGIRKEGN